MGQVLAAIGEALIDFIPAEKGCAFDEVTSFRPAVGGAPANVCGAYAKLGGKTRLMTQLGKDPFGDKIVKEMQGFGIDTTYVARTSKANTALAFVSLAKDGNRTFSFYRNPSADMLYTPEQLEEGCFEDLFALHFCSVSLGDFPMKEAHRAAIAKAREKGAIISFDPNLRFPLWPDRQALKDTVLEFLPLADVLKVSDEEIAFLTGETDIQAALPKLFVGQVKLILFTCGKEGACAYTKQASGYSPCEDVPVADTTGAGDGFMGSFLWKLHQAGVDANRLEGLTDAQLNEMVDFSNRFCTISVQSKGAIASYPTLEEMGE